MSLGWISKLFRRFRRKKPEAPTDELLKLRELALRMQSFLAEDHFVAKSEYLDLLKESEDLIRYFRVLEQSATLHEYCGKCGISDAEVTETLTRYDILSSLIDAANERFIEKKLADEKDYLDTILKDCDPALLLDVDQRRVVLSDEDYTLVIAGAGAGKTTTVAAKVKYLVDKQGVDPRDILVISFTNKAVNELKQRIKGELHIDCPIATFHSTGNAILHMQDPERLNIVEASKLYYVVLDYLRGSVLKNEEMVNNLILFFGSYFDAPYEGEDLKDFFNHAARTNHTTMRSELDDYKRQILDRRSKKTITIQNEVLRSHEEVVLANFLYLNGLDYEYEPIYRYHIEFSKKPYTPDFLIRQGDLEVYLEHFGISEDGQNSLYSEEELAAYKQAVNDKVRLHRAHGTKLIYTFSSYRDGRAATDHLKEKLEEAGFLLTPRSNREVLEKLLHTEESRYIRKLVTLITRFISNFKTNGYTDDDFTRMYNSTDNVRSRLFLLICQDCYLEYERYLRQNKAVDFQDMINDSVRVLRDVKEMKERLHFRYIIVDEYQDISRQRFDLVTALHEVCDAKFIAVGDDWQSIYAFSGSDITLFTDFAGKMGYANLQKIVTTYRNSQEVIDIAGNFIQKNRTQIEKDLIAKKHITDPVIIYTYDSRRKKWNDGERSGALYQSARAVEAALEQIIAYNRAEQAGEDGNGASDHDPAAEAEGRDSRTKKVVNGKILLLGRFNFDGDRLAFSGLFEYNRRGGKLISKKFPDLDITFMTAHAAKGLGYDNVIVLNGQNATYGFPAKIEDDPVLSFVVKEDRSIAYAEERRLFYVAMTRTKNRVYFIAPKENPSEFLLELKRDYRTVALKGEWNDNPDNIETYRKYCPICGYPLQLRYKPSYGLRLYICTNEPEVCSFMTNNVNGGKMSIIKCDRCRDGYLVVKHSRKTDTYMLGCTNYKPNGKGCSRAMNEAYFRKYMGLDE